MIKFTFKEEHILSENPLDDGVTVTCFARQKKNYQLHFAIIKDEDIESLTIAMSLSNTCSSRTIRGRKAKFLRKYLIDIYKNNKLHELNMPCPHIEGFQVVSSDLLANSELQGILCKVIANRLECTQVWIEDEQLESIPEIPSAHFIYMKDRIDNFEK